MEVGDFAHGGIYAGTVNSHHIICSPIEYDLPCEVNWYQASDYCKAIGMALPTKEELNILYELSNLVPDQFRTSEWSWYWSSTESSSKGAWLRDFSDGGRFISNRSNRSYVRPIKRIKI